MGLVSLACVGVGAQETVASRACFHHPSNGGSIYDFEELDLLETKNISLADYKGKVVLIVNVATYWDYTDQYLDMNVLQESFSNFEVLAFPCNQFGMQEPGGSGEEIKNGITHVRPGKVFEPNFTLFKKIEVNGDDEHPLYTYLKAYCPTTRQNFVTKSRLFYSPLRNSDVRWNWEKFLITKSGKPFMRYDPSTKPQDIRNDIIFLLQQ